jgi:hypothetical protein
MALQLQLEEGMTLGEHIAALQRLEAEHGTHLRVQKWTGTLGRHPAPEPVLAWTYIDPKTKEPSGRFWTVHDSPESKGTLVVRV